MMGAPTVMTEKLPQGDELMNAFRQLEQLLGRKIDAVLCGEAGGINSTTPFVVAAAAACRWSTATAWAAPILSCRW